MQLYGWQRAKYINDICVDFIALCHYNMYITTDANRPENDQVSKTYVYYMTKLSIKHLFTSCG